LGLSQQWDIANEAITMDRDIKDVIGILMPVLDSDEVSHEELDDLAFNAHSNAMSAALRRLR
jgi:hypothetical protein